MQHASIMKSCLANCTLIAAATMAFVPACIGNSSIGEQASSTSPTNYAGGDVSDTPVGVTAMRRLNNTAYNNSVRDLLGTAQTPADNFTADAVKDGFNNNGEAQVLTLENLNEDYAAASQLALEAINSSRFATLAPCAQGQATSTCLTAFIQNFGEHAWRRPLLSNEVQQMTALATSVPGSTYAAQVQVAITAFLSSPNFMFMVELDPSPTFASAHALNSYELATRLSYFLWNSTPDANLLAAADDKTILTDAGLSAQVTRMLADPRSASLATDFGGQWMQLGNLTNFVPDATLFPKWDNALKTSMIAQTQLTLTDVLHGETSLSELYLGDTTYLNDRLASHYGLPAVNSNTLIKVDVPAGPRRGLLGQAAILTSSSLPIRTSLVRRGVFVLDQLLCSSVPPPPANVPALAGGNVVAGSQRTRLLQHVVSPECAACHTNIDPYGFVLENFDAIGAVRTSDGGFAIDTNATLPDGSTVEDVTTLQAALAADARVANCAVTKMTEYALGRSLTPDDTQTTHALQSGFAAKGLLMSDLVRATVMSPAFRTRRGN